VEKICSDFHLTLIRQGKDNRTCNSYRNSTLEFLNVCEITEISQLQLNSVTDYDPFFLKYMEYASNELKNGYTTLKRKFTALNKFFSYLVRYGFIITNPIPSFREWHMCIYKEPDSAMRYLPEPKQVKACLKKSLTIRVFTMHFLFSKTGVRPCEMIAADIDDFKLDRKVWVLKPHPKRTGRVIPLDNELIFVLKIYFGTRIDDNPALFLGPHGKRIHKDRLREEMREAFYANGMYVDGGELHERASPYSYRCYHNTQLDLKGMPRGILKEIRGDQRKNDDTAERYILYNEKTLVKANSKYMFSLLGKTVRIPKY